MNEEVSRLSEKAAKMVDGCRKSSIKSIEFNDGD